jgi:Tfp pilus assembly protein PilF
VNEDVISLKEVLQYMDSPMEFGMLVITANKQRNTGGEELHLKRAWGHNQLNRKERAAMDKTQLQEKRWRRNPNHYDNSTRNVRLPNADIITIHIRLIREFNGKTVL